MNGNSSLTVIQQEMPDRKERAIMYDTIRSISTFIKVYAYWKISEEKLYEEFGYSSIVEYGKDKDRYSKGYINKLLKIGRSFFPYMDFGNNIDLLEIKERLIHEPLSSIPILKLYPLTRLNEHQRNKLVKEGAVVIRGKQRTINELKKLTEKEITLLMRKKPLLKININDTTPEMALDKVITHINAIYKIIEKCTFFCKEDIEDINNLFRSLKNIFKRHMNKERALEED